ncbi:MAG: deoxyribodipyrimidine photo-lyase [Phycisphaerae bacterium]|nr:deoxyribodipyrimidine photo-lyase [Phycisphaerae bacterium]
MIESSGITSLNTKAIAEGKYVLYWMQAAQRGHYNHALQYAIDWANKLKLPAIVCFGLTDDYPEANLRHYHFMLTGLKETQLSLREKGIKLVIKHQRPDITAIEFAQNAALVITDDGPMRIQKQWRREVGNKSPCLVQQVQTNVIVPIAEASDKENYSAGTLRPRINAKVDNYLVKLSHTKPKKESTSMKFDSFDISDTDAALAKLKIDRSVSPTSFIPGTKAAQKILKHFTTIP